MIRMHKKIYHNASISRITMYAVLFAMCGIFTADAAVVSRASVSSRPTVSIRPNVTGRMPTTTASGTTTTPTTTEPENSEPEPTPTPSEAEPEIENKSSQFDLILTESSTSGTDTSAATLAELVRQQRAELDAADAVGTANRVLSGNQNACDMGLRACMREKCGEDFTECSGDTDTIWGNKMDTCRNDLDVTCTGEEYRLFASEIKSDRDMNARLASYNAIIDCGNRYNDCIVTECGTTFGGCLGKSAGDAAIAKCETIAQNCIEQDSGLASRAMQVFANLRVDAEEQIQRDTERLYELRDQMAAQCQSMGASLDTRTLTCVFTVNFYAGEDTTLYASKKLFAGDVFDCTPNWFGIDITTFMENAYRLTRSQTSASSALLGSGLGVTAGAITSGAIERAIDRQRAENALKDAKDEHDENYGTDSADEETEPDAAAATTGTSRPSADARRAECEKVGGTWKDGICTDPDCGDGQIWDDFNGRCRENTAIPHDQMETRCKIAGGMFDGIKCTCSNGGTFNTTTGICECAENQRLVDGICVVDLQAALTPTLTNTNSNNNSLLNFGNNGNNTNNLLGTRSVTSRGVGTR